MNSYNIDYGHIDVQYYESGEYMKIKEWSTAFAAGVIVGGVFTILGFPLPAPGTIGGVMGIVGVFLGTIILK